MSNCTIAASRASLLAVCSWAPLFNWAASCAADSEVANHMVMWARTLQQEAMARRRMLWDGTVRACWRRWSNSDAALALNC
jgi:hypothetical protein